MGKTKYNPRIAFEGGLIKDDEQRNNSDRGLLQDDSLGESSTTKNFYFSSVTLSKREMRIYGLDEHDGRRTLSEESKKLCKELSEMLSKKKKKSESDTYKRRRALDDESMIRRRSSIKKKLLNSNVIKNADILGNMESLKAALPDVANKYYLRNQKEQMDI